MDKYKNRQVMLVDQDDQEIGVAPLIEAHRDGGQKHRAFSLVLYRKMSGKVEILLQQRARSKPIFSGYWANTCCYNLAPGEEIISRAKSRVNEEMGIELRETALSVLYKFSYEAEDHDGWCENEVDSVIVGEWPQADKSLVVKPNPEEVKDYRWVEWGELKIDMKENPDIYAPWWKLIVGDGRLFKYLGE